MIRWGIDFGGTIGYIEEGYRDRAIDTIRTIVDKYGTDNVFIVSRARQNMQKRILEFLSTNNFYQLTGMKLQNVHFVVEYIEKAEVVKRFSITHFIDDHIKIVGSLVHEDTIQKIWYLCTDWDRIQYIPKKSRCKVVMGTWKTVAKGVNKLNK